MGTDASVTVHGGSIDPAALFVRLQGLERRWSRFRPDSEISRLNRNRGEITIVSPDTFALVEHLVAAWRLTGGRFDPTMLDDIVDLGYDRTYRDLEPHDRSPIDSACPRAGQTRTVGEVDLLAPIRGVVLGAAGLDPGGLGKGFAADLVADRAMDAGASGVLVDVGGDIRVRGTAPDGEPWRIAVAAPPPPDGPIDEPFPGEPFVVELGDGAMATSSVLTRTWTVNGEHRHHLLDPATGMPVDGVTSATVLAGTGWWAEAMTKAVMVSLARNDGWFDEARAEALGVSAVVTTAGGTTRVGAIGAPSHA